jgi:DNA mismatch repair protein MSH6
MQPTLFQFFNPAKKKTVAPTSPLTKQAAAMRTLKRVSRREADDDFTLELSNESDSGDDAAFQKAVTAERLMKSNSPPERALESDSSEDEAPAKRKPRIPAPKPPRAVSPSTSTELLAPTASDEPELPEWLTTELRDADRHRPGDHDYDPTTVFVPKKAEAEFSPFQQQFWGIKRYNFDAVVMIRKGKFYEMFSVDAIFARDTLKLRLTARGKEPMCGVPDKAFSEWALKIINSGRRVCKVEQMETAVDQKHSGSKAMKRELVQVYSAGTIDDFEMLSSSHPSFLMALRSSGRACAGVCLVDCSTGSFHLGVVNEGDLADVLIRFEPVEIVYSKDSLCSEHLDIVKAICGNCATHAKSGSEWWDGQLALNSIQRVAGWDSLPAALEAFQREAIAAFGGCVAYLNDHKIAKPLLSLHRFSSLDEAGGGKFLALDSSALTNLQIIGKDEHCLLNIIDRCTTPFGKRRLRFWVMHPLRTIGDIEERLQSVEELMDPAFIGLSKRLQSLPDLERILSRVYSNRCTVRVFIDCLEALEKTAELIGSLEAKVQSSRLKAIAKEGLSVILTKNLAFFNRSLDKQKSLESAEFVLRRGVFKDIDEMEDQIKGIEDDLQAELKNIRRDLGIRNLEFVHQQSERYQVEIPTNLANNLDDRFLLISQTKAVKRYRTEAINKLIQRLEDAENTRLKLRNGQQKRFVDEFASNSALWDSTINQLADLDCLLSLAAASQRWGAPSCRPNFVPSDTPVLAIKEMRHPCIVDNCIPNDVSLTDKYILIITGPNASGKSTFARMCCVAIILAQIGCYLPAQSATLTVYDQIFTRIGAGDRLFSGQSTFAVELSETARLMKNATQNSFVVLDELGRGTSTFDGIAIATAVLEHFIQNIRCPLVFCTHYHVITQQFEGFPMVRNASMKYSVADKLILLHKLIDGPCSSSFGCDVAKMCGLAQDITNEAQDVANDFERRHKALHLSSASADVTVIEMRPELRKIMQDVKAAVAGGTTQVKLRNLLPLLGALGEMDLG